MIRLDWESSREIRAQVGFTRIEPVTPDLQGEFDLGVKSQVLGLTTDWVPACEIRGEGVFLRLGEKAVRDWEDRAHVTKRGLELLSGYDAWAESLRNTPDFPGFVSTSFIPSLTSSSRRYPSSAAIPRPRCANASTVLRQTPKSPWPLPSF